MLDDVSISADCPHLHVAPGADVKDDDGRARSDGHGAVTQLSQVAASVDHLDLQGQPGVAVQHVAALLRDGEHLGVEGGDAVFRDAGVAGAAGEHAHLGHGRHVVPPLLGAGE